MIETTVTPGSEGSPGDPPPGPTGRVDWTSTPTWRASTARTVVDAEMVVWSDAGIHSLVPVARAVAEHLDGTVSLDELAADLADVAGLRSEVAREVVSMVVAELTALDALDGPDPSAPPAAPVRPAPSNDRRSAAEGLPLDSCLGFRLRDLDDVPLLSFRGGDAVVRSVRCHDPEVAGRLREGGRGCLVEGRRGPIEAFVVTPLEGCGPLRVYDGEGVRRGRPRTPEEAADLVDQILGGLAVLDALTAEAPAVATPSGLVALRAPDGRITLTRPDALDGVGLAHRLRRAGFRLTWAPAVIGGDGRVAAPSAFDAPAVAGPVEEVVVPGGASLTAAERVRTLLGPTVARTTPAPHGHRSSIGRRRW